MLGKAKFNLVDEDIGGKLLDAWRDFLRVCSDNMTYFGADTPRMSYSRYCNHGKKRTAVSRRNGFLSPTVNPQP